MPRQWPQIDYTHGHGIMKELIHHNEGTKTAVQQMVMA